MSAVAAARARLYAKSRNYATASDRVHSQGETAETMDALRNASSDLLESASEYVLALTAERATVLCLPSAREPGTDAWTAAHQRVIRVAK